MGLHERKRAHEVIMEYGEDIPSGVLVHGAHVVIRFCPVHHSEINGGWGCMGGTPTVY